MTRPSSGIAAALIADRPARWARWEQAVRAEFSWITRTVPGTHRSQRFVIVWGVFFWLWLAWRAFVWIAWIDWAFLVGTLIVATLAVAVCAEALGWVIYGGVAGWRKIRGQQ